MCDSVPCNQQENCTTGVRGKHSQLAGQIACVMKEIARKWYEGVLSCISSSSKIFKDAPLEPAASGAEWQYEGAKVTDGGPWAYKGTMN